MARITDPDCKQCRREGCKLFLKGERCLTKCSFDKRPTIPGVHTTGRKKVSEYGKNKKLEEHMAFWKNNLEIITKKQPAAKKAPVGLCLKCLN